MNLPANLAIPQDDDWRQYVRFVKWEVLPTGGRRVIRPGEPFSRKYLELSREFPEEWCCDYGRWLPKPCG